MVRCEGFTGGKLGLLSTVVVLCSTEADGAVDLSFGEREGELDCRLFSSIMSISGGMAGCRDGPEMNEKNEAADTITVSSPAAQSW
jgi:hypothetical protein